MLIRPSPHLRSRLWSLFLAALRCRHLQPSTKSLLTLPYKNWLLSAWQICWLLKLCLLLPSKSTDTSNKVGLLFSNNSFGTSFSSAANVLSQYGWGEVQSAHKRRSLYQEAKSAGSSFPRQSPRRRGHMHNSSGGVIISLKIDAALAAFGPVGVDAVIDVTAFTSLRLCSGGPAIPSLGENCSAAYYYRGTPSTKSSNEWTIWLVAILYTDRVQGGDRPPRPLADDTTKDSGL